MFLVLFKILGSIVKKSLFLLSSLVSQWCTETAGRFKTSGGRWQRQEVLFQGMASVAGTPWNFCFQPSLRKSGLGKAAFVMGGLGSLPRPLCRLPRAQEQLPAHTSVIPIAIWEATGAGEWTVSPAILGSSTPHLSGPMSPESFLRLQHLTKAVWTSNEVDNSPVQRKWSVGLSKKASVGGRGSYSVPEQGLHLHLLKYRAVCTSRNVAAQYRCWDEEKGHLMEGGGGDGLMKRSECVSEDGIHFRVWWIKY